jgi:hypothetical protein
MQSKAKAATSNAISMTNFMVEREKEEGRVEGAKPKGTPKGVAG